MKQEFELVQSNTGRLLLMWLGGLVLVTAVAIWGSVQLLAGAGKNIQFAWLGLVMVGGVYVLHRSAKAVGAVPTRVTVAPDRLTIYQPQSSEETQVLFSQIAAYRAWNYNGAHALRLTLKDERKLQLRINSQLHSDQDFGGMVAAFEAAIAHFQQESGPATLVRRERNFFEKPISTLLLVLLTAFLVGVVYVLVTKHLPVKGSLFVGLGSYITYLASWYAARERRNQAESPA